MLLSFTLFFLSEFYGIFLVINAYSKNVASLLGMYYALIKLRAVKTVPFTTLYTGFWVT